MPTLLLCGSSARGCRPPGFPFTLNSAVDELLKKEFDLHRAEGSKHPLMEQYGIDAVPIPHADLDVWRHNFTGVQYLHEPTNLLIFGAIDDLWENPQAQYIVVDYKATSKNKQITELDEPWHDSYKRQMEVYQWLLRRNGYDVSDTGYIVYCNGNKDKEAFDGRLEFELTAIPYTGSDAWVEDTIHEIHNCLNSPAIPESDPECDYCTYREAVIEAEQSHQ
jgi:CRISPR/Cas system-associated exonuclease Cas4 (RecB family)